jgi:hypothetical protein
MAIVRETFSYDDEEYPELAEWLAQFPRGAKSAAIRDALIAHVRQPSNTELMEALQDVRAKIERLKMIEAEGGDPQEGDSADAFKAILDDQFGGFD